MGEYKGFDYRLLQKELEDSDFGGFFKPLIDEIPGDWTVEPADYCEIAKLNAQLSKWRDEQRAKDLEAQIKSRELYVG